MKRLLAFVLLLSACTMGGGGSPGDAAVVAADGASPDLQDASRSSVHVAPSPLHADGRSAATITVRARTRDGTPLPDLEVSITVSGSGNSLTRGSGRTDADGNWSAALTSTTAETKRIAARIGNVTREAQVIFTPVRSCAGTLRLPSVPWIRGTTPPRAVVAADFDGDGTMDLAAGGDDVALFHGRGDGTFTAGAHLPTHRRSRALAAVDLDGNGWIDLVAAEDEWVAPPNQPDADVLLNRGKGVFAPAVGYGGGTLRAIGFALGDLDGDGRLDLVVAHSDYTMAKQPAPGELTVRPGRGDGTFGAAWQLQPCVFPSRVALGDFDSDGATDIVVACDGDGRFVQPEVRLLRNRGGGKFDASSLANRVPLMAVADLDEDGHLDLVLADGVIEVLAGKGDGTFRSVAKVAPGRSWTPAALALIDLDGDGHRDVAASNWMTVSLFRNDGAGQLRAWSPLDGVDTITAIAGADFDRDGHPDLVMAGGDYLGVTLGLGGGRFDVARTEPAAVQAKILLEGDWNNDGQIDLVAVDRLTDVFITLLARPDGTFEAMPALPAGTKPSDAVTADFDGDGNADLAIMDLEDVNRGIGIVTVYLGGGDGRFDGRTTIRVNAGAYSIAAGDWDDDGVTDLAAGAEDSIVLLGGKGDGTFRVGARVPVSGRWLRSADLDRDGRPDLLAVDGHDGVLLLHGRGDGGFTVDGDVGEQIPGERFTIADWNGDGLPDLALVDNSYVVRFLLGTGARAAAAAFVAAGATTALGAGTKPTATGDLDGDGNLDLAVLTYQGAVVALLGHGDGTFEDVRYSGVPTPDLTKNLPSLTLSIAAGDWDLDGRVDLLVGTSVGLNWIFNRGCLP